VKTLLHFAQEITASKIFDLIFLIYQHIIFLKYNNVFFFPENFQQFDYGLEENIKVYNCSHPPIYNLSSVIAPIAFYYAKNDILADPNVSCC